jgi:hypothetical protein
MQMFDPIPQLNNPGDDEHGWESDRSWKYYWSSLHPRWSDLRTTPRCFCISVRSPTEGSNSPINLLLTLYSILGSGLVRCYGITNIMYLKHRDRTIR